LNNVRIALAQIPSKIGDVRKNTQHHIEILRQVAKESVDFVCFPELSLTGYLMKDVAYEVATECSKSLTKIARETKINQRAVVGFVRENDLGFVQNAAATLGNGKLLGSTAKFYLPTYGLFEETRYFAGGNPKTDLKVFESPACRFGIVVCEDAWHPEPIEALARLGADLVFCIASSPAKGIVESNSERGLPIEEQWMSLLKAHALMNTIFVVFVNRSGPEDEEYFWGGSAVISPSGKTITKAKRFESDLLISEIDLDEIKRARRFTSFRDHNVRLHEVLIEL